MRLSRLLGPLVCGTALLAGAEAQASSLVYQPINPSFGGSPLNGAWLQAEAAAQNDAQRSAQRDQQLFSAAQSNANTKTPGQIFAQQLQTQIYSSLANQITQALFGENAQQSGSYSFGGSQVTFQRLGTNIQLQIFDGQSTTTIVVPATAAAGGSAIATTPLSGAP
ncbi:membrane Transport [Methylobacterium phyllosphaerae]|jgi:curli production assembly/transport component CsgF|uniref:Curli production assembly/transport component CsgF n=2 Tax=Methylobacterium TaxID=407 RepID=A0AAE8L5L9_9HYPH|nr:MULTISPECIES: curli assembly protein CsgF [Methylobacterium]AIQ93066.1 protein of unassigned function [Methylobacterium oryzae CBMB20]APT33431.1 membrane Transport [Methylobacterium phyllosphaerae]SFG60177.1 curli production assembly/transport component CsgF [Methylobacterium phyllosphaerae]